MDLFGPKGAPKVGPKAAHLRGYINSNAAMNSSRVALQFCPTFAPKP